MTTALVKIEPADRTAAPLAVGKPDRGLADILPAKVSRAIRRTRVSTKRVLLHPGTGTGTVLRTLAKLGAVGIEVDSVEDAEALPFDAVLLLGGADINPYYYGQPIRGARGIERERDAIEWILARRALDDERPLMGFCRGHQMVAVASGGSLYQDINSDIKGHTLAHEGRPHELLDVVRPLRQHLPKKLGKVNSYHHQAVKTVPHGFDVAAVAADGIIEAIWRPGVLGVQWHPELLIGAEPQWIGLFQWLLKGLE